MRLGIIGCGLRMNSMLKCINSFGKNIEVTAVWDEFKDYAMQNLTNSGIKADNVKFYDDVDEMLESKQFDGIMIGTRCSSHTRLALKALKTNLPLFLEKPVSTTLSDLELLRKACFESKSEIVVSFPLRVTPLVGLAKEIVDSGKIGTVEHVQAINNVPYGGVYFHRWFRDENEAGGLFLQKATHDFDYINYILGIKPVRICAVKSKQIFKGDKPAGLKCVECDEYETCMDSPYYIKHHAYGTPSRGDMCCYAVDTGNEDSGSAIIQYESGMHVSYSQNFFVRNKAAARGARFLGYKGTIEFDWFTGELKVFMHKTPRVETYKFDSEKMSHFGGDDILAFNFIQILEGKAKSVAPIEAGLTSALMCIKARESAQSYEFKEVSFNKR